MEAEIISHSFIHNGFNVTFRKTNKKIVSFRELRTRQRLACSPSIWLPSACYFLLVLVCGQTNRILGEVEYCCLLKSGEGCCLLAQPRSIQWELIIFIAAVCNVKRHAYYVLVHTLSASHRWLWVLAEALRDFKFSVWNGHLCRSVGEI